MSEPEVGSDLAALACTAKLTPDGQSYILNGRKMWISAGSVCDICVVACLTDTSKKSHQALSLLVVERGMPGFETAKVLKKIGKNGSDTCLLTFKDVFVPHTHLIGKEGEGFLCLMRNLPKERMSIAVGVAAACRRCLAFTMNYINGRQMFGGVLSEFQSVQLEMARMRTEVQVLTTFVDECILRLSADKLSAETAAMAKVQSTDLLNSVATRCLQLYGGYGYLRNNPVARMFTDGRVCSIFGGSNEVLLELIGKGMGFKPQRLGGGPKAKL